VVALAWTQLRAIDRSVTHRDEEIEVLKRVKMFRPLPMPAIDSLALRVRHLDVPAGQDVVRQGEAGDQFFVIDAGEADVIGDGTFVTTIGPGDGFGEIALLRDTARTTTVRARTSLRLYTLERADFLTAVTGYASSASAADDLVTGRLAALPAAARPV
jgi:CRP-like cAMP-binding protein